MSDETYRRYYSGKYNASEGEDFTPSDEENKKMKKKQEELDKSFKGEGPETAKKLRNRTREVLEEMEQ